ncbi:hypothetical protein EHP00_2251 [Ecytonucleospora hepatopenaei]|uniref:Uncharacterized protein n=1 Tax=Ecytonucleospora hepatopenaei TaxID=646526 RepID=A0A1W0E454_9MICR|nr:hypothetical protein EHP00_2251 [Ecytonucleospora hepatopenaei]
MIFYKFIKMIKFLLLFSKVHSALLKEDKQQEMMISSTQNSSQTFKEINNPNVSNVNNENKIREKSNGKDLVFTVNDEKDENQLNSSDEKTKKFKIAENNYFNEIKIILTKYVRTRQDYFFIDFLFSGNFSKTPNYEKLLQTNKIFKTFSVPNFKDFATGTRVTCSNIYRIFLKKVLPLLKKNINGNLKINTFLDKSSIARCYRNLHLKVTKQLLDDLDVNVTLNSSTNLILCAHKFHNFMLINYKKMENSLKLK